MNLNLLALVALVLAGIPAGLFLLNLLVYRPTKNRKSQLSNSLSVLIPARNEEQNIGASLKAVLANRGCNFEVIVLDDHSSDRTAEIVRQYSRADGRVRLETAPALPPGWCGKQHACFALAQLARNPLLVFMDADVRLESDALARMASFLEGNDIALASGVPRQELGTVGEHLLIPLIHFILLGFLPMHTMRHTRVPAFSAGCGQLFIARRDAYQRCGGHAMLRNSLHDGIKLPRVFRQAGFATDLFDATDIAACRMYHTSAETWRGLGKNATEGLAAPGTILPFTVVLLGGQVLPFALLAFAPMLKPVGLLATIVAVGLALLPRLVAVRLFRQPLGSALLHPFGVMILLLIQWQALVHHLTGKPSTWKGRSYSVAGPAKIA